jgi:transposase-like protein
MRGRHAVGPEIAEQVADSPFEGQRLRLILESITGHRRVQDVCAEMGVCSQMFERLRDRSMRAAARSLRLKKAGRPRQDVSAADARVAELERENVELRAKNEALRVRIELAEGLPRLAGKKP